MTAPTHILTGLATVVVVGRVGGPTPDAVSLLAFIVGTLAPDIDGQGAITRPGTILRQLLGREVAHVLDAIFQLISATIRTMFGHRGFMHSPLIALCLIGSGDYLGWVWLMWFGGGYAAHLLGDALTAGGIPAWSPLSSRRVSLSGMKTGSRTEYVLAGVLLVFVCLWGWALLPEQVKHTHRQLFEVIANSKSETESAIAAVAPSNSKATRSATVVQVSRPKAAARRCATRDFCPRQRELTRGFDYLLTEQS